LILPRLEIKWLEAVNEIDSPSCNHDHCMRFAKGHDQKSLAFICREILHSKSNQKEASSIKKKNDFFLSIEINNEFNHY
jgi:hypothetical protein